MALIKVIEAENNKTKECFITLGRHKIAVSVSNGVRFVKHSDIKELLNLSSDDVTDFFIDSKIITETLFNKIYIDKKATTEQKIIYQGLCMVGLYCLIDEACKVDLRGVSYIKEFNEIIETKTKLLSDKAKK